MKTHTHARSTSRLAALFGLLSVACALAGCGPKTTTPPAAGSASAPAPRPLTKITLQTDWYAQPEHGGFYQALVKGYYREAGLDVTIEQGGPNVISMQRVALGNAHFAIGRSDDLAMAVSRGIPVVGLGAFMQRDPQAIMFHDDGTVKSFKDLDGRTLLVTPGTNFVPVMEKKFGIKVALMPLDYGLSRFLADKKLVQQCFITNEPYYVRKQGVKLGVFMLSETGFATYRLWFVSRDFMNKNPEVVRAFSAATIRGWQEYISGDRKEADALIGSRNKQMVPEFIEFSVAAMKENRLVEGDPAKGEMIGRIDPARLGNEIAQLSAIGVLSRKLTVEDIFDDRSLPEAVRMKPSAK